MIKDKNYHILVTHNGNSKDLDRIYSILEEENITFTVAGSLEDSVNILQNGSSIDLIISYLAMTDRDQWKFNRILRSPNIPSAHTIPLILLSDSFNELDGDELPNNIPELRADAYLPANFKESELRSVVKKLLGGKPVLNRPTRAVITTMEQKIHELSRLVETLKKESDRQENSIEELTKKLKQAQAQFTTAQKFENIASVTEGAVHNFSNLLTSINGLVSMMQIKRSPDDQDYSYLELIQTASLKADELLKQLLTISSNQNSNKKPICLNTYVRNIINLMRNCTDQPIEFHMDLEKDLLPICADPNLIEQVIMNLCINSCHAIPEKGQIVVKTTQQDNDVCMTISDTGVGMDEVTLSQIFKPYFTTKEKGKGTGLGLSSVANIIKDHQGYIEVDSELGKGTCFKVHFPACEQRILHEEKNSSQSAQKCSGKILVIDDEELIRDTLKDILTHKGYTVLIAENGARGLSVFMEHKNDIDLVIIDMNMPIMNGFDAFYEIKKINPFAKILLTTGQCFTKEKQKLLDDGIHGFLQKPFSVADLSREVEHILSSER
ncbi:MAG: response regulator [bacterium]